MNNLHRDLHNNFKKKTDEFFKWNEKLAIRPVIGNLIIGAIVLGALIVGALIVTDALKLSDVFDWIWQWQTKPYPQDA